ncbi:MAG: B12-binding domain-containing radical SAM protein [Desulfurococcales archaeon]|nr:B12-binding domain-containing radical SAM protein [Desulfurococcales archaeon]
MKVLLTLPPGIHDLEIYKVTGLTAPPLGLAYIAAVLEREGYRVKILDTPTLKMDLAAWLQKVKSWSPDVIGFSILTPTAPKAYVAARKIKEEMNDVILIAGGQHPTYMWSETLDNGFDIIVRGEGEITIRELIKTIDKHGMDPTKLRRVAGIVFRDKHGNIVATRERPLIHNLDELPWPARHLLPMDKYTLFGKKIRVAHIMASRGCPYGCIYCTTSYYWGRRIRYRSPEDVAEEIGFLVDKYRIEHVVFTDDELTANRRFVYGLIEEMKKRGLDIGFACGARINHMDKEFMEFLYNNGCVALYFGVESGTQRILDKIGKMISLDQVRKVFRWKREIGGFATASFILGFPWETIDDMKRTVDLAIDIDPDYAQFTVLTPYPGTPLFDYAMRYGLIEDWNWEHYTTLRPVMRGFKFTREQVAKMLKYAYRKFFIRSAFILRELRAGRLKDILGIIARETISILADKLRSVIGR